MKFDDGANFIKEIALNNPDSLDGVIIDNTDVDYFNSAAQSLFKVEFFADIFKALKNKAIFA